MKIDRRNVLEFFAAVARRPMTEAEIAAALRVPRRQQGELKRTLDRLTSAGDLVRTHGERYGLPEKLSLVTGELRCSAKGYGFVVSPSGQSPDVFVHRSNMAGALHRDQVVARIERRDPAGRVAGSVIRILARSTSTVLGRVERGTSGFLHVVPMDPKLLMQVLVPPADAGGAEEGQLVEAEVLEFPTDVREAIGRVTRIVGRLEDPAVDLELVLSAHQLPRAFPEPVLAAASRFPRTVERDAIAGRRDFRAVPIVTIDGEHARDFDDAVSVARRPGGGFELQVHVADVASYVEPGSVIDDEAVARGTSVYFPDHVIPMLPEQLSNGLCSLRPDEDWLTLSAILALDAEGTVIGYELVEGVIRSHARMTYEQVHRILEEGDAQLIAAYASLVPMFQLMAELAKILAQRRRERGSLDFDLPEPVILLDDAGAMTGIRRGRRLISHSIIEEFMILANETVARHFADAGKACLYRVHEAPDEADIEALNRSLKPLGFREVVPADPGSFRALLESARDRPEERFVNSIALRALRLARYQPANLGHYGLAATAYSHFTSPIRRYPDLVLHRLVKADLHSGPGAASEDLEDPVAALEELAESGSRLERRAEDAEREYVERKKARFMLDKVGEQFDGVVTAVEAFGFFVELDEYLIEGLVHVTSLDDDFYQYQQDAHRLVGENTGTIYRLGEPVRVEVMNVDLLRRRIDFVVVGLPKAGSKGATGRGRASGQPRR